MSDDGTHQSMLHVLLSQKVRLKAAFATLVVAPEATRQTLQAIVDRDEYPQRPDAFGMLRSLDEGRYKPS